jgi:hypothetical protein
MNIATPDLSADITVLETLRTEVKEESFRRQVIFVPLALAIAAGVGWVTIYGGSGGKQSGSPALGFLTVLVIAGALGWIYATSGPMTRYVLAFKQKVLPRLLARYGQLTHDTGTVPPLARLIAVGFLPTHSTATVDDEIRGRYRDRPVLISELTLVRRGGKNDTTPFRGLLVEMTVSPPFTSTTLITDNDVLNNTTISDERLERVHLEDPRFNEVYRVFGTDQIAARAVLTPAVMEKLLILADGQAFNPPYFFCEGDRMVFALNRWDNKDLFEPPSFLSYDAAQQLLTLDAELAVTFGLIDAMIEMQDALKPHSAGLSSPTRPQP